MMKRFLIIFALGVSALWVTATDRFFIEDFTITPGESCTLSIMLENELTYTAFQTDIYMTEGLTIEQEDGEYIFDLTSRKARDHNISSQQQANGSIRIMSYSPGIKAYSGNSGALVTFNVTASNSIEGPVTIRLSNILFTTTAGAEVAFNDEMCTVTVPDLNQRGDVDGDGKVDIADVSALIDYLLTGNASLINIANADADADGDVNITDLSVLIDYLLGIAEFPPMDQNIDEFSVNGVTFKMVSVEGGTFTMGATEEEDADYQVFKGSPQHQVTLSSFSIGQTEVTQELWVAVMGSNPSTDQSDLQYPVNNINWEDCEAFITALNQLTGKQFRLPTEAEWEYAAKGGARSQGYVYAGSDNLDEVAWTISNSDSHLHQVATKKANELDLYDMNGNIEEWLNDWYSLYTEDPVVNPTGPETGTSRIHRGGRWNSSAKFCRLTRRDGFSPSVTRNYLGLRLALDNPEVYTVNGVSFTMIPVKGGTFTMGATEEEDADYQVFKGSPQHQVTLSSFNIGQTEVTQELWVAVMGSNPSTDQSDLQYPVNNISWEDCEAFITALNQLTGKQFRLPTEAEWEYAAKGGTISQGYVYSGSDNLDEVAWTITNSDSHLHQVATKKANELDLYDMNGNIEEWLNDWYALYTEDPVVNPTGPETGTSRIHRGGRWNSSAKFCRLTRRDGFSPSVTRNYLGLRLALTN